MVEWLVDKLMCCILFNIRTRSLCLACLSFEIATVCLAMSNDTLKWREGPRRMIPHTHTHTAVVFVM